MISLTSGKVDRSSATARSERPVMFGGLVLVTLLTLGFGLLVDHTNYDVWASVATYAVIMGITAPALWYISRVDKDPKLFSILVLALAVKLLMALARYYMINVIYKGEGDAAIYHAGGVYFADHIKAGYAQVELGPFLQGFPDESKRVGIVTGVIYLFTGPSQYAGFFVFSWFSYIGNLLLARGFRWGFPEGLHRRYTLIVMFLPSLLFWPSSIGKEGWMMLCLGLVGYGSGKVLAPEAKFVGLISIALGLTGAMWIRPHMALVAGFALIVGLTFWVIGGRVARPEGGKVRNSLLRTVVLGLVTVIALAASSRVNQLVVGTEGKKESTSQQLDSTVKRTFLGSSKFETQPVRSPVDLPIATLSVIFRPFPWEAGSFNALISSAEGALFLFLGFTARRSVAQLPGNLWRRPYLVFCMVYSFAFIVAFSNIANAGILARQRVQMLPVFLVVLAIPANRWWATSAVDPPSRTGEPTVLDSVESNRGQYSDRLHSVTPMDAPGVRIET